MIMKRNQTPTQHEIDKTRALYHYYKNKPDLLSKCKSEVLKYELEKLKSESKRIRDSDKINVFLDIHPEYRRYFKKD